MSALPPEGGRTSASPVLTVRNLRCTIAGQQVVEDVSFDVPATGITAVLGRNGVGKTSTLRGILGLIARRGEVRVQRVDTQLHAAPEPYCAGLMAEMRRSTCCTRS